MSPFIFFEKASRYLKQSKNIEFLAIKPLYKTLSRFLKILIIYNLFLI